MVDALKAGHQAMVFVHSRKDTGKTGRTLALKAQQNGETALFDCSDQMVRGLITNSLVDASFGERRSRGAFASLLAGLGWQGICPCSFESGSLHRTLFVRLSCLFYQSTDCARVV